jgi:hypothetical protein
MTAESTPTAATRPALTPRAARYLEAAIRDYDAALAAEQQTRAIADPDAGDDDPYGMALERLAPAIAKVVHLMRGAGLRGYRFEGRLYVDVSTPLAADFSHSMDLPDRRPRRRRRCAGHLPAAARRDRLTDHAGGSPAPAL